MIQSTELNACRICGLRPVFKKSAHGEYSSIVCEGEGACSGLLVIVVPNDRLEEGVIAWNQLVAASPLVNSLAMCIRKMAWLLNRKDPGNQAAAGAMKLLQKHHLQGSPLRDE